MSFFDEREECPHCDAALPSRQLDIHVARTHADLPPCTARCKFEHGGLYTCAFRAGHEKGQYGRWHASVRGDGVVTGRYVWDDSAKGATPHRAPEPTYSLDKLKAMGVVSHTIVAASEPAPELEQPMSGPCPRPECGGVVHTDPWGTSVQCPHAEPVVEADTGRRCPRCDCPDGHEQCEHCKVCPHATAEERQMAERDSSVDDGPCVCDAAGSPGVSRCRLTCPRRPEPPTSESDKGHPEQPAEEELNPALPVRPDPRQPAYDAVYEYIRALGRYLPPDSAHRNAVIWRAVHAALDATPVGRCVSSHCVEGGHILELNDESTSAESGKNEVRCPSCEHGWDIHSDDGCWHTVAQGRAEQNLVCACRVARWEAP